MKITIVLLIVGAVSSVRSNVNWVTQAKFRNYDEYYFKVMQETMQAVERLGWSQLKLLDMSQELNEAMYDWLVEGTVTYSDGFLVSIQKIDVEQSVVHAFSRNSDNRTTGWIRGLLNWREVDVGFDVTTNLTSEGQQQYTGIYHYTTMTFECALYLAISPDNTKEVTTDAWISSLSANSFNRMHYMPTDRVTEVLARKYSPSDVWNSVSRWATEVIAPAMLKVVTTKFDFPDICFSC